MNITFENLRNIKHQLPTGSIHRIAEELSIKEQTVRNYFGAADFNEGKIVDHVVSPGPGGGIVNIEDPTILELAQKIILESQSESV